MAGDIDDVVDAAGDPIVTVLVADTAVSGEVVTRIRLQIYVEHTLVVSIDRAEHRWPRLLKDKHTRDVVSFQLLASGRVKHAGVHTEHGQRTRAWLHHMASRH